MSRTVAGYEVLQKLGEGGMADVYLARQIELDRLVALKELRALRGSDTALAKRFLREARMAGSLSHPNIVTVYDYIVSEDTPFIAMEYMERGSLRPWVGRMSLAQVGGVFEGVLGGLAYAGARGIVHRDIKPENVMIGSDGRVKIADFGIAKARDTFQTTTALTADGTALGTPNYMAPEQAAAEDVTPRTDLYAVGVMAFEMFVGRPPFADTPSPLVVLMRHVQDQVPRVTDINPAIDPRIADWIAWLTAKEPAARPASGSDAWESFEEILVSLLGPRWQRSARLLPGQVAPVPAAAAAAAPLAAASTRLATSPTRQLEQPAAAATIPANPHVLGIDRTTALAAADRAPAPARHRGKRALFIAAAVLALLAVGAAAAMKNDSAPVRAAQTPPKPSHQRATAPSHAPTPTSTVPVKQPRAASPGTSMAAEAKDAARLARQYRQAASKIERLGTSGAQGDQNALLADLTRKTADAYSRAAAAARRNDQQGYTTALAQALAAKSQLDSAARAPAPVAAAAPAQQASPCAGDSQSDDPSDDSCGGEP
ncbi:MAG TPA: serine/threonine-protein kinase [Thermoleophilaceae bacterium]|nr:serine/threonine-protein kinase [Thermoleophilaceae bacterium]